MAAAVNFTSSQDHALTMASRQDELLGKISKIQKSLPKISEMENSLSELGQIWEMEKSLGELGKISEMEKSLAALKKLISEELGLLRPFSRKHGAVRPYPSLPMVENASTTVNQGEDRSLFLMVTFTGGNTDALYEVKFKFGGEVEDMGGGGPLEPVATFSSSTYLGARIFDRSQLYVFSEEGWDKPCVRSFGGYIFDTKTRALDRLTPSTVQFKQHGTVVSAYGTLYFLEAKTEFIEGSALYFGKYNHDKKDWVQMPRFPFSYTFTMGVIGYAVGYGIILFILSDLHGNFDVVAFHVGRQNWKRVEIGTCIPFRGRAMIVGKTIYALHMFQTEAIIAYSLEMKEDDDGDIAYSLVQLCKLNGLEIADPPLEFDELVTDYLVHLGNQDFVHVKTATNEECDDVQHLCITTCQIVQEGRRHMIETLHSIVLPVKIEDCNWFLLTFGFTPECGDYEPVEGKSAASVKQPKQEDETTLDENSLIHEKEVKHEIAFMQHEKACQKNHKDANGIIENNRQKDKKKMLLEGGITGSRKQAVM
ncbi:unnamed protein product [Prunus armeniaca]|uniref:Uncharacterized protein n=1 Tax=Prunus armeniaca TaxID=36596 RepID=A0A6J5XHE8_PRUAR|nr:unnamed protein product [Prunus armeniaca]CAB4311382.1 unnamed protein product [Prunus armeniaca]